MCEQLHNCFKNLNIKISLMKETPLTKYLNVSVSLTVENIAVPYFVSTWKSGADILKNA